MQRAPWLGPLTRSRQQVWFSLTAAATVVGVGFIPLFAGPRYESALAAGLILPALAAAATAMDTLARRLRPSDALAEGSLRGLAYAVIAVLVAFVHGLRAGFCDPWEGLGLLLLGGGFGAVMGGVWGGIAGLLGGQLPKRARTAAVLLALLGPAAGIGVSLVRFYTSPMVFAYDPFFGVFAGPLYDTVVDRLSTLATYRMGSLCTLTAVALAASYVRHNRHGRLVRVPCVGLGRSALCGSAAVASLLMTWFGAELGHFSTDSSIARALGRQTWSGRCHVVFSSEIPERQARLMADQCEAHLADLEGYFGVPAPPHVRVLLFATPTQKGQLTGASRTQIAKPWRREVYIHGDEYPHRVLRHELAHVMAAAFGSGPFRVAGPLGGLIPDPGRIEGVAEAAAPDFDADLTLQQWAHTLLELELLPPLPSIFRITFLGENSSSAYTVAGAFVQWFRSQYGAEALRRWYGGESLRDLTHGQDLEALEQRWRTSLAGVAVPPQALPAARARFDRPAIFGRRCPRVVDRLAAEGNARLAHNDALGAEDAYRAVLGLDPGHDGAKLALSTCALREGDPRRAQHLLDNLTHDETADARTRSRARERIGDLLFLQGKLTQARAIYTELAGEVLDADQLRTLELKLQVSSEVERRAVAALLIGDPRYGTDWLVTAGLLGAWAASEPADGTPRYLLGRNLFNRGRFEESATYLDAALRRRLKGPRLRREAYRIRTVVACALGDRARAERTYRRYLAEPAASIARRAGMHQFARLCKLPNP